MSHNLDSERLEREQSSSIHRRRILGMGKRKFVTINTLIFGNGCFALVRLPILCHFWYGRTISHHGKMIVASVGLPLCLAAGFAVSLWLWRGWERGPRPGA